jgi:two-component system phosphate regulon response regulator PhoB
MTKILIVEDEAALVDLLRYNLEAAGYDVVEAYDGEKGYDLAVAEKPDIILLDWMLPVVSGIAVCKKIRKNDTIRSTPIIMLTARGGDMDKIEGLDSGADDYVTKPFSPTELIARVKALLRRAKPSAHGDSIQVGDVIMDLTSMKVKRGKREIHLGPTEFRLLLFFMENPGRVFSREQLMENIWGGESDVEVRTVDVLIRRLRKALNEENDEDVIRTVRSAGYSFDPPKA